MESVELYNKYLKGNHWEKHPTIYAEEFSKFLKQKDFKGKIIDAGCGIGRDCNVFKNYEFDIGGINNSEVEIRKAREAYPKINFELQDIEKTKFKDKEIGAIFCINVIHYLKKEKAIKEFLRILKPGGYLYIHFNIEIKGEEVDYYQSEEEILSLVKDFKIVQKEIIKRTDKIPFEHHHKIMKLILQK